MNRENRPLITWEPVEAHDFRKTADRFWRICGIYLKFVKKNRKNTTCNRLDLETTRISTDYAQKRPRIQSLEREMNLGSTNIMNIRMEESHACPNGGLWLAVGEGELQYVRPKACLKTSTCHHSPKWHGVRNFNSPSLTTPSLHKARLPCASPSAKPKEI